MIVLTYELLRTVDTIDANLILLLLQFVLRFQLFKLDHHSHTTP